MADTNKTSSLPLTTAIVGAAVGAAAVMLSKKENRDKLTKKVKDVLNQGEKKLSEAAGHAERTINKLSRDVQKKV